MVGNCGSQDARSYSDRTECEIRESERKIGGISPIQDKNNLCEPNYHVPCIYKAIAEFVYRSSGDVIVIFTLLHLISTSFIRTVGR